MKILKSFAFGATNVAVSALMFAVLGSPARAANEALPPANPILHVAQANNGTKVAPALTQYWFTATYEGDTLVLDGYVPDEVMLRRLSQTLNFDTRNLELASGESPHFGADVDFGLKLLSHMGEGRFSIRSSVLTVKGTVKTTADYMAALALIALGPPEGSVLALSEIKAPRVSPYIWSAEMKADRTIALSGLVPDADVKASLEAGVDNLADDALAFGSGEPAGFEASAMAGLGLLANLDSGKAAFDGKAWSLSGSVDTAEKATKAEAAFAASKLADAGWIYKVSSPEEKPAASVTEAQVTPYIWSATKSPEGDISFAGYVPDDGFRRFIATRAGHVGEDTSQVGAGAPDGFGDDALAGFVALTNLQQGKFAYDGTTWNLSGTAASAAEKANILKVLTFATDTDAWKINIDAAVVKPAPVEPYVWSASKAADGTISLSGFVPTEQLKAFLPIRAGAKPSTKNTLELASGEPSGFIADALAGLEALPLLSDGQIGFDGKTWSIKGTLAKGASSEAVMSSLATAETKASDWAIDVKAAAETEPAPTAEPAPAAPAKTEPSAAPVAKAAVKTDYRFAASKPTGASIALSGSVPADATKSFFGVIAGDVPTTELTVAAGAPEHFIASATAGLRTLATLESGDLFFNGQKWFLKGKAATPEVQAAGLAAIAALPSNGNWVTQIAGPPAIDVCRNNIAAFAPQNPILFDTASSHLTENSVAALVEIARYLAACPEAYVYVEGHTDSDGDDNLNLALSVARSEAVVAALTADGIKADHLYAVGYGESMPIADNKTSAGKQANRRIVFTLRDKPE